MKKRLLSTLLALCMVLALLPGTAFAAEPDLPDWYFLIIFASLDADYEEDGETKHVTTTISDEERATLLQQVEEFGAVLEEAGVMTPHFTNLVLSTPITVMSASNYGPFPHAKDIVSNLEDDAIDLDAYDHAFVFARTDGVKRDYGGITGNSFDNGTTYSFIPAEYCLRNWGSTPKRPAYVLVHEFLHTMQWKIGCDFDLHAIEKNYVPAGYQSDEAYRTRMLDIILNRITGEHGSGVFPGAWQYPPHVLRTISELTIPEGVTAIRENLFRDLTNLEKVTIPNGVTSIGTRAFRGSGLTSVTIPNSVTTIDLGAFGYCNLETVTIPGSVTNIGSSAFYGCSNLKSVNISSGVGSVGDRAFHDCVNLKSVSIPVSVTEIGYAAFSDTGVTDVYYAGTEDQWNAIQFDKFNSTLTKATIHYNRVAFSDVPANEYYANAVVWAVANGVTGGTGNGKFSPDATCNQAQILTFLWRAKGEPEPASAVSSAEYYAKAAQWAKEQGLTDAFSAEAPCTRAMVVTYLWKLAGSPVEGASGFTDVPASASYSQAVAWAVKNGVTSGTGNGAFSPDQTCTRAQIVTFLYRALA